MSQIWQGNKVVPVTLVQAGPVKITQVRNKEKDGYEAVQVGFDPTKKHVNKSLAGHLKDLGNFRYIQEFRAAGAGAKSDSSKEKNDFKTGDVLTVSQFQEGDKVKVSGLNRGRGFQGGVKRHGFRGGPKTHGQKNRHRAPGSIGATAPQRVLPGTRMAGHMGQERKTVRNVIAGIDAEKNILMLKGAVPGMRGTLLEIKSY